MTSSHSLSLSRYQKREIDRIAFIAAIAISLTLTIAIDNGCAAHTRATSTSVSVPVTAFQQVLVDNDILANANKNVAKAVIVERNAGNIPPAVAHDILSVQDRIARLDTDLSRILALGPDAAKLKSSTLSALITQISNLTNDPALGGSSEAKFKMTLVTVAVADVLTGLQKAGVIH